LSEGSQTLLCTISSVYDSRTRLTTPETGEDVFTFKTLPDGSTTFSGAACTKVTDFIVSDSEYFIACDFMVGSILFKRTYTINRYSGTYETLFQADGSKDYSLHSGKCEPARRKF